MHDGGDHEHKLSRIFREAIEDGEPDATPPEQGKSIRVNGHGNIVAGGDINIFQSPPKTVRNVVSKPGEEHITEDQKATLRDLVEEVVETENKLKRKPRDARTVWKALNRHCRVSTYSLIPISDFEKARSYLNKWLGRLNALKSAPIKNADRWRQRKYSYIKINVKDPEDEAALRAYMLKHFRTQWLTELANDELERAYRYVAGRRSRRKR